MGHKQCGREIYRRTRGIETGIVGAEREVGCIDNGLQVQIRLVADKGQTFLISGSGDVIDPDEPLAAIGSGGSYATAAARALMENTDLSAREIAEKAMKIAGEICIYTNDRITIEELKG